MKSYVFNLFLIFSAVAVWLPSGRLHAAVSADTLRVDTLACDSAAGDGETDTLTKYDKRVEKYRRMWNFLIPTQVVAQYAGNMGVMSFGVGWNYGNRRQYETNLLFGYLPRFHSERSKTTMTLKQNFIPWRIGLGGDFNVEPLSCGIYFNTVFGHEFWGREPRRYPDKYYQFLSTKVRVNIFVGQRVTAMVPHNRRKFIKSLTAFYEISTCDIYLRSMFQDGNVSLGDILGLSIGLKAQMF
ncbi:MAG: hypothetical protein J6B91_03730 [Prevotella sp.]|nr:hypothetical protein [Prevotella sp.]